MRLTAIAFILTLAGLPAAAQSINVTGEGRVTAAPDLARITLGVTAQDADAGEAVADMEAGIRAVLGRLAESGIADTDIQTSALRLEAQQDYSSSSPSQGRIVGYLARSTVTLTVRDLDRLGPVIGQAVADGANRIDNLWFDVTDRQPLLAEARRLAVADAAARATLYADAAGVTLGAVTDISEPGADGPSPMVAEARSFAQDGSVTVMPGEIEITARINLSYAIAP